MDTPATPAPASDEAALRETLKRCSPATLEAACAFRRTRDAALLPTIVRGVIERFVERELRAKLQDPPPDLRLAEDLRLDSLTIMEIVMLAEEVLPISISNDELRHVRTLGDIEQFVARKIAEPVEPACSPLLPRAAQPQATP